jgi:Ni/Co efflux regulator RcnB
MITAALALCLMGGAAAAQDRDHGHDRGGGGHEEHRGGPPGGGEHRGPGPGARPGGDHRGPGPGARPGGAEHRGPGPGARPENFRGPGPGRARGPEPGLRPGGWLRDRGWHRSGSRFHAPSYRYPSGFGYRRWAFGAFLPGAFLGADYFIGSYWTYGLPAPPPGYHWIRVGPDALLVRYGDGYVLDAVYGIFY